MAETIYFRNISDFYSDKIGIEIREENELFENELKLIEKSGLSKLAKVETWTALGTNQQLAYATHGIFRYFGKFPPPVSTYLISKYTNQGDLVIDPMCGSGTTAVEASILGRKVIVNDLNPLSILLAKVKTTKIPVEILRSKLEFIKSKYKPLTEEEYCFSPVALNDYEHWFLKETSDSLRGLKYLIEQEPDTTIKNYLNVIFAATIRRVSKATTQQGRLFLDVETALPDALPTFVKRYQIGIDGLDTIPQSKDIQYLNTDLKELTNLINSTKLVILHPPYFNSYKYSSVNSLETGWLGIDRTIYSKKEVKEYFKVGKPENAIKYVEDMSIALTNSLNMLKKGGHLGLMIGDTIMKKQYIPVTRMLIDNIDLSRFSIETIAIRVPKYTEATWVASQRRDSNNIGITLYDYIIIFKRIK